MRKSLAIILSISLPAMVGGDHFPIKILEISNDSVDYYFKAFPNVKFITGHSRLLQVNNVMEMLSSYKYVMTDTSFQAPGIIKKIIKCISS